MEPSSRMVAAMAAVCLSAGSLTAQSPTATSRQSAALPAALVAHALERSAAPESEWVPAGQRTGGGEGHRSHQRYRQRIDGLLVVGGMLVVHAGGDDDEVRVTGFAYPRPTSRNAVLSEAAAGARAVRFGAGDARGPVRRQRGYTMHDARLVYVDAAFPRRSGQLRLAYAVDLQRAYPFARHRVYVDAEHGALLGDHSLIHHAGVPGSVATRYSGRQAVTIDSLGAGSYVLHDPDRGITVTSAALDYAVPTSPTPDFASDASEFGGMAGDVFFGAGRFYDLFADSLGWIGLDGQGESLEAVVDDLPGESYVNAYWNGSNTAFGQGDCHYMPLTTLDVVGHEFMHGVTDRTSDLIYAGESGALNEGFSDIFGKALERIVAPERFTWDLGNGFADSEYAENFRSMADPRLYENPRVYGGEYWEAGNGVHTNSGPLGHWFYLLVEGGAGVNELGDDYDVAPLDIYTAMRVAFATTRDYLTPSSDYAEAREGSLLAAAEAYGDSSAVYRSVAQAWRAIGVHEVIDTAAGEPQLYDLSLSRFSDTIGCSVDGRTTFDLSFANSGDVTIPDSVEAYVTLTTADGFSDVQPITRYSDIEPGSHYGTDYEFEVPLPPGSHAVTFAIALAGDNVPDNDTVTRTMVIQDGDALLKFRYAEWAEEDCRPGKRNLYLSYRLRTCSYSYSEELRDSFSLEFVDATGNTLGVLGYPEEEDYFSRYGVGLDVDAAIATQTRAIRMAFGAQDTLYQLDAAPARPLRFGEVITFQGEDTSGAPSFAPVGWSRYYGYLGRVGVAPGDTLLATTGAFGTDVPCLQVADNLEQGWTTGLALCVDYIGVDAPELEFDVLQFHGEAPRGFDELIGSARGLRVSWGGTYDADPYDDEEPEAAFEPDQLDIGSTRDGVRERQRVLLPDGYRGIVRLNAYNASGTSWEFEDGGDPDFERFDYTMVDDFGVRALPTSTVDLAADFTIGPNPADAYLMVGAPLGQPQRVLVHGPLGRVVRETWTQPGGQLVIDTGDLPAGVYVLTVGEGVDRVLRQRVAVQH